MEKLKAVLKEFGIVGVKKIAPFGTGLINSTYKVDSAKMGSFLLQKLNLVALPNIERVLLNIEAVGEYLKGLGEPCLLLQKTKSGKLCVNDGEGFVYRVYPFIENSVSYDFSCDPKVIFEVAYGFGRFDKLVKGIKSGAVKISDEHFHDSEYKYQQFKIAVQKDLAGRKKDAEAEILEAENLILYAKSKGVDLFKISSLMKAKKLEVQVVHNDTKLNNCLLDNNNNYLCVVDLDTCMPGLVINDFADGVRYIANCATEDEEDLSKVGVNLSSYSAFAEGFFKGLDYQITSSERELLATSVISIAFELGCRFLADYLNGDVFFRVSDSRPKLNLIRARVQFAYCKALIDNLQKEEDIIKQALTKAGKP